MSYRVLSAAWGNDAENAVVLQTEGFGEVHLDLSRENTKPEANAEYQAWLDAGNVPAPYQAPPLPPIAVSKIKIVERLAAVDLLEPAYAALSQQPLLTQKRWEAAQIIASDDAETRAFLTAIGADPDAILA